MCGYFLRKLSEDVVADVVVFSWDRPLSEVITEVNMENGRCRSVPNSSATAEKLCTMMREGITLIPSEHIDFVRVELSDLELMVSGFFGDAQLLEVKLVAEG